ncbi:hypothetical protein KAR91_37005 [Candidatus Pacearchaeota archaeon]|nr:hypothetical protein [Candidatus Pacearchaeota archaeon]
MSDKPTDKHKTCNHHHEIGENHEMVDFGDGAFVANKAAIPLLKALSDVGLRTRTHHYEGGSHGFVSILLEDKVTIEIKTVQERDTDRTKYNGKKELLIMWHDDNLNSLSTEDMAQVMREADERLQNPPCLECGAMTAKEAETMCICAGDKDYCHGQDLWPDGEEDGKKDDCINKKCNGYNEKHSLNCGATFRSPMNCDIYLKASSGTKKTPCLALEIVNHAAMMGCKCQSTGPDVEENRHWQSCIVGKAQAYLGRKVSRQGGE